LFKAHDPVGDTKKLAKNGRILLRKKTAQKNGWNRGLEEKKKREKKYKKNKFGTVSSEET